MKVIKTIVTLEIQSDVENDGPGRWDYNALLDLAPHEYVAVISAESSKIYKVNDEGEPI